jgi:mRNA interferase YafQ
MKLFRTKTFKKDYQKLKITDQQYEKYIKYVFLLLDDEALPDLPDLRQTPHA